MEILLIIEIILIAVMAFLVFREKGTSFFRKRQGGDDMDLWHQANETRARNLEQWADDALRTMHCEVSWTDEKNDRVARFDYQNGHFRLRVEKSSPYAKLMYLFCYTTDMENLDNVRMVCNKCNINSDSHRLVYTVNEEKHEVDVHILTGVLLHPQTAKDVLADAMSNSFSWQNALSRRLDEIAEQGQNALRHDKEKSQAEYGRELFLARQHEMMLQSDEPFHYNNVEKMGIRLFLDKVLGLVDAILIKMEVMGGGASRLISANEIGGFNLIDAFLVDGKAVRKEAMAMLWIQLPSMPGVDRRVALTFTDEGSDGKTTFFRITASLVPLPASPDHPFRQKLLMQETNSVLVAYDQVPRQQLIDECVYMWKEAVQKMRNGEEDSLTEEQRMIAQCNDLDLAQLLYHGKKMLLAGRFYEALMRLENAFLMMQPHFDQMKTRQKETFFEVIYHIGFCYCELKQYIRAEAYLNMVSHLHRITYTTELINSMVNSGDFRALAMVENLADSIRQNMLDEEEDIPEPIRKFLSFLDRRKVYLLVDKQLYNEARILLNKMLEEPDNADFALNELAYIQKLEKDKK